jgi:hypothetical protein
MRTVYVFPLVFAASVSAQATAVFDTGNGLLSMCDNPQERPYCLGTAANRPQEKYTILVTAVIGSAVVPTLIAQRWFQPTFKPIENESDAIPSAEEAANV